LAKNIAQLAYLGDAVFELMVRDMLVKQDVPHRQLTLSSKAFVTAVAQAEMYHRVFPLLNEEEQRMIKRGRNLHTLSRSKNAKISEYRHSTGLEVLFGHLYINGELQRLTEIFEICMIQKIHKP